MTIDQAEVMAEVREELADQHNEQLPTAVPTPEEVRAMIEAAHSDRDQLVVRLLYATGIRANELAHLMPEDIQPGEGTIFIKAGKEAKDRYVLADSETLSRAAVWPRTRAHKYELFGMDRVTVQNIVDACAMRAGIEQKYRKQGQRVSPHTLRHYAECQIMPSRTPATVEAGVAVGSTR